MTAVGILVAVNGLVLLSTRWRHQTASATSSEPQQTFDLPWLTAILIGTAQGLAVLPGISRSGMTIATALLCGMAWRPAATFSFMLSIPAILGALLLELRHTEQLNGLPVTTLVVGVAVSFAVGMMALGFLWLILRGGKMHHLAWYCFASGRGNHMGPPGNALGKRLSRSCVGTLLSSGHPAPVTF
jgi:undecaprenyl-diphosphatase